MKKYVGLKQFAKKKYTLKYLYFEQHKLYDFPMEISSFSLENQLSLFIQFKNAFKHTKNQFVFYFVIFLHPDTRLQLVLMLIYLLDVSLYLYRNVNIPRKKRKNKRAEVEKRGCVWIIINLIKYSIVSIPEAPEGK